MFPNISSPFPESSFIHWCPAVIPNGHSQSQLSIGMWHRFKAWHVSSSQNENESHRPENSEPKPQTEKPPPINTVRRLCLKIQNVGSPQSNTETLLRNSTSLSSNYLSKTQLWDLFQPVSQWKYTGVPAKTRFRLITWYKGSLGWCSWTRCQGPHIAQKRRLAIFWAKVGLALSVPCLLVELLKSVILK